MKIDWINNVDLSYDKFKNDVDYKYLKLGQELIKNGLYRTGRNGGTLSLFGTQLHFDLAKCLPILTTKKILTRSVIHELIWLLQGKTSAKYL